MDPSAISNREMIFYFLQTTAASVDCPSVIALAQKLRLDVKQPTIWSNINVDCCAVNTGVYCVGGTPRVDQIHWDGMSLDGTLTGASFPPQVKQIYLHGNSITGSLPTLPSTVIDFVVYINQLTGAIPSLVFIDEMGVFRDSSDNMTVANKKDSAVLLLKQGNPKSMLTVMSGCYGDGKLIKPLILRKTATKKTEKIDIVEKNSLTHIIGVTKTGWMTKEFFKKYVPMLFPNIDDNEKYLIVFDTATSHVSAIDDIKTNNHFKKNLLINVVPGGCTGICQVSDVGLIKCLKHLIKKKMDFFYFERDNKLLELSKTHTGLNVNQLLTFYNRSVKKTEIESLTMEPSIEKFRDFVVSSFQEFEIIYPSLALKTVDQCYLDDNIDNLFLMKHNKLGPQFREYYSKAERITNFVFGLQKKNRTLKPKKSTAVGFQNPVTIVELEELDYSEDDDESIKDPSVEELEEEVIPMLQMSSESTVNSIKCILFLFR